ncbi:hypothetical protein LDDCCGHA_0539 [Methylobacterium oxalidis]|nr:hypothetical protein LDDCCGHA_0539 [Methylobacterium oxalidis]
MLRSSKTSCVRQVVKASMSCSQRAPTMVRRSSRRKAPWSAVTGTVAPKRPFASRLKVVQPGAAVAAVRQPRWKGLISNWFNEVRPGSSVKSVLLMILRVKRLSGVGV